MGLSSNEKRAAQLGMSVSAYKKTSEYKNKKKGDSKKESKKDKKKAEKQTKKYYKEKEGYVKETAETSLKRLQEDLSRIFNDLGIQKTRALEDYTRNIGNIEQNKGADVDDLNYYVETSKGRTQEDLDTALAKETRRYELESENINQNLADAGLTFSERTPEKIAQETSRLNKEETETEARRSFQDIARYEATKNRDIEIKYGQQTTAEETTKTRTLEDIIADQTKAQQSINRSSQDIKSGLKENLSDLGYSKSDALSDIGNYYTSQSNQLKNTQEEVGFYGK
jgi:hypothetical protein